ncbi:TlpA family protein disulfide reductase [Quisquiliibacterium transsilvanicum]|uniref:Thiol-disulfide isomerase/thioredoxin n=1 Tax=Quisquiliibacterium transsilvanicum TaxID=1549638 RepID=A0A7W8MA35_9BURK|nr:TlpA disulfide reductase family protein [Quisquiliibacterium transsilvanicum]MBB5273267.1 thiol-disulfide isomerase/thioredoxin [Quisquiliibacterium transsilvanicum]
MSGQAPPPSILRRRALSALGALAAGAALPALAAHEVARWPAGRAAPPLEATDLDGKTWRLADLRGRAVLLNFWASWCEPCRAEMPSLQTLADFHGQERLAVLAINFKEPASRAARFVQGAGVTLPVLLDPEGAIARAWEVRVFPTSILTGVDGKPRHRVRGEVDWTGPEAARLISTVLASS